MEESIDRWFDFVEKYYKESTVPLSWTLIGGGEITSFRMFGSPNALTNLSKQEWRKIVESSSGKHCQTEV